MVACLLVLGCQPELGECDQPEALRIAYNAVDSPAGFSPDGHAAYEGQAIMNTSCGAGGFCHAADSVPLEKRFGVPAGLTFDVLPAQADGTVDEARVARLRRARFRVVQEARLILQAIDSGQMPVYGPIDCDPMLEQCVAQVHLEAPQYVRLAAGEFSPLPGTNQPEGREILRNWLACGAPAVERGAPRDDGVVSAVVPPLPQDPIEATWESIYENLIRGRGCARSLCHGADPDAGFRVLGGATGAIDTLMDQLRGVEASGTDCDGMGTLIVPGDPDASLFLQKLRGTATCGDPMPSGGVPLRAAELDTVAAWIEAGAMP